MLKFVFDLDGTITSAETLPIISSKFNVHRELEEITKDTVAGKISWKKSFLRRVEYLRHIPVNEIDDLLHKTPLYPKVLLFIRKNLDMCCIATGNLDCWIHKLCNRIGCDYYSSKAIVKDNELLKISQILEKADVVESLQNNGHRVVFIGDSNNDVNAMRKADISIAYGASHKPSQFCISAADYVVYSEKSLIELLVNIKKSFIID